MYSVRYPQLGDRSLLSRRVNAQRTLADFLWMPVMQRWPRGFLLPTTGKSQRPGLHFCLKQLENQIKYIKMGFCTVESRQLRTVIPERREKTW